MSNKNENWISYKDSEVQVYHPLCDYSLKKALQNLHLENDYYVLHHQMTGSLEMDFCIVNINTGKYLCVVEVKRTPMDVNSARYQYQAMSYVQMNAGLSEKPYYVITNLETMLSFRYETNRTRVFQQILKPGHIYVGSFNKMPQDEFVDKLTNTFTDMLNCFINDKYEYAITLDEFAQHIYQIKNSKKQWKSHLAILLYEYIRGALSFVNRNELKDIRLFNNDLVRICLEATKVNFKDIFNYSDSEFEKNPTINSELLSQLFEFGKQNVFGDSISNILHQIVSEGKEQNGEVPTDLELARIVSILAKYEYKEETKKVNICDPAAGSGNLISSAIEIFNLMPNQIKVNDINPLLLELLSLRLGLNYPKIINPNNTVQISNSNISELDNTYFDDTDIVLLNPPFIAGIRCVDEKGVLYKAIEGIKGVACTKYGQMPYEAPFLELLCSKLKDGTIIACILSKTLLLERGNESRIIRKFLLDDFGLSTIFTYPGNEIFDKVTKDTCVLVGKVRTKQDKIKLITSYDTIPNINLSHFEQSISKVNRDAFENIMPGVQARLIDYCKLKSLIDDGWRIINSELLDAVNYVSKTFEQNENFVKFSDLEGVSLKRGTAGNKGASDLIFCKEIEKLIRISDIYKLQFGIRNAKIDDYETDKGDSYFININAFTKTEISKIISNYQKQPIRISKQSKNPKDAEELYSILVKESSTPVKANSILIPRDIRRKGRIYYIKKDMFVSTNFMICNFKAKKLNEIYGSWMLTIFYQLICETSAKDEAGTRKMELTDIINTFIPKIDILVDEDISKIKESVKNVRFIDLQNPQIREIDKVWARILFANNYEKKLHEAQRLLTYLANRRNT